METDHGKESTVQFLWISHTCKGVIVLENIGDPTCYISCEFLLYFLVINVLCHGWSSAFFSSDVCSRLLCHVFNKYPILYIMDFGLS